MQDGTDSTTQGAGTDAGAGAPPPPPTSSKIPFDHDEIEAVAESALKTCDPDIKWDELSARAKHEYKELTVSAIRDEPVPEHLQNLIGGEVERAESYQRIVLRTLRQSPKWDEDAFVRGYVG